MNFLTGYPKHVVSQFVVILRTNRKITNLVSCEVKFREESKILFRFFCISSSYSSSVTKMKLMLKTSLLDQCIIKVVAHCYRCYATRMP